MIGKLQKPTTTHTEDTYRDTCQWCNIDVLNMVGPPSMARVSGQAGPGQDTTEWTICLECYVLLIKFISNLQHVSGAVDRRSY